jgi:hypothetical protein
MTETVEAFTIPAAIVAVGGLFISSESNIYASGVYSILIVATFPTVVGYLFFLIFSALTLIAKILGVGFRRCMK